MYCLKMGWDRFWNGRDRLRLVVTGGVESVWRTGGIDMNKRKGMIILAVLIVTAVKLFIIPQISIAGNSDGFFPYTNLLDDSGR